MLKSVSSITNSIGALNYKGTWNASTNTPTLTSSVGTKGDYYVVSVAGATSIDGISNWGVGDWIAYNGSTWQRVEGGADLNGVNLTVSGTTTLSNLTASTALALDASKNIVSVTNTGTGSNVLATSPSITTPRVITSLNDTNGNELIAVTAVASAVNELTITNAAIANSPTISATGADTNIDIKLTAKGTGNVIASGLLVGATASSGKTTIQTSTTSEKALYIKQAAATSNEATAGMRVSKSSNNSTTGQVFIEFTINNDAAGNGQINANGASAAAFGSFSDRRLKENITDLPPQLANILALRTVEFDYIQSEGGGHQIGFIAQEVQDIYPDLIGERADGMLTLTDLNKNDARLIKAIQEQQFLITALTARITALETKGN